MIAKYGRMPTAHLQKESQKNENVINRARIEGKRVSGARYHYREERGPDEGGMRLFYHGTQHEQPKPRLRGGRRGHPHAGV